VHFEALRLSNAVTHEQFVPHGGMEWQTDFQPHSCFSFSLPAISLDRAEGPQIIVPYVLRF